MSYVFPPNLHLINLPNSDQFNQILGFQRKCVEHTKTHAPPSKILTTRRAH